MSERTKDHREEVQKTSQGIWMRISRLLEYVWLGQRNHERRGNWINIRSNVWFFAFVFAIPKVWEINEVRRSIDDWLRESNQRDLNRY